MVPSRTSLVTTATLALALLWSALAAAALPGSGEETLVAFVGVTVVPMDREGVLPGQTVLVRGDRVEAVGPTEELAPPAGATVVDGAGRFLLPGLTDAMGVPLALPGSSLHLELEQLAECGLTSFEVLRTATVMPARFLGREDEWGTVAEGQRADLLLVAGNPLEDLAQLRRPEGVMVRGRWLPREALDEMVGTLGR